jgi:hypothetical protein
LENQAAENKNTQIPLYEKDQNDKSRRRKTRKRKSRCTKRIRMTNQGGGKKENANPAVKTGRRKKQARREK